MSPIKVLMVCLGNICRSPLAEGILKSKIKSHNLVVDSAGTAAFHEGSLPDKRSIAIAHRNGIDITDQRARKISLSDLDDFDHIFVMDESNYTNVMKMCICDSQRIKTSMIMDVVHPKSSIAVPDPYYGAENGFEEVYQMLDTACDAILKKTI